MKNLIATKLLAGLLTIATLSLALETNAATPCLVTKNKWGQWIGDCKLSDFFPEIDYTIQVAQPSHSLIRLLPNLFIDDISINVIGTSVMVSFTIVNDGASTAAATTLTGVITVMSGGNMVLQPAISLPVSSIGVGGSQVVGTTVTLPNRMYDHDFTVMSTVDPTMSSSPGGVVRESNETDNDKVKNPCRVYALKNPDVSLRACS